MNEIFERHMHEQHIACKKWELALWTVAVILLAAAFAFFVWSSQHACLTDGGDTEGPAGARAMTPTPPDLLPDETKCDCPNWGCPPCCEDGNCCCKEEARALPPQPSAEKALEALECIIGFISRADYMQFKEIETSENAIRSFIQSRSGE